MSTKPPDTDELVERACKGQAQSGTMSIAYRRVGDCPK